MKLIKSLLIIFLKTTWRLTEHCIIALYFIHEYGNEDKMNYKMRLIYRICHHEFNPVNKNIV